MPKGKSKKLVGYHNQDSSEVILPADTKEPQPIQGKINVGTKEANEASQEGQASDYEAHVKADESITSSESLTKSTRLVPTQVTEPLGTKVAEQIGEQTELPSSQSDKVAEPLVSLPNSTKISHQPIIENINSEVHGIIDAAQTTSSMAESSNEQLPLVRVSKATATTYVIEEEESAGPYEEWTLLDDKAESTDLIKPSAPMGESKSAESKSWQEEVNTGTVSRVTNFLYSKAAPAISDAAKVAYDHTVSFATNPRVQEVCVSSLELLFMSKASSLLKLAINAFVPKTQVSTPPTHNNAVDTNNQKLALLLQISGFNFLKVEERQSLLDAVIKNPDDKKMFKAIQVIDVVSPEQKAIILKALYCNSSAEDQVHEMVVSGQVGNIEGE